MGREGEWMDGILGEKEGEKEGSPVAYEIRKASFPPSGLERCGIDVVKGRSLSSDCQIHSGNKIHHHQAPSIHPSRYSLTVEK